MIGYFRFMLTLCLVLGFYLCVPVSAFPADSSHKIDGENIGIDYVSVGDKPANNVGIGNKQGNEEYIRKFSQLNRDNEFTDTQTDICEQLRSNIETGPKSLKGQFLNSDAKSSADLHTFNNQNNVSVLKEDVVVNTIQISKSAKNSQLGGLSSVRLEQMQQRLDNLSAILQIIKHKLTMNNIPVPITRTLDNQNNEELRANNAITRTKHLSKAEADRGNTTYSNKSMHYTPVNGITWSHDLEERCPNGFQEQDHYSWKAKVLNMTIVRIERGCGSMQNRLVTFSDSSKACARYRLNIDQMQGEIYSYYLSKLFGLHYTPPTSLHVVENSYQWRLVWEDVLASKWSENNPIIFTEWVESLEPVYLPEELKDQNGKIRWVDYQSGGGKAESSLCNLLQWTDLIVFDYLSANLDRVLNNMVNLKWNHEMLEKPIHNLEKSKRTGQFVWIDNESGLFHGYRLLETYHIYHQNLLESICTFRQSTIDAVKTLHDNGNAGEQLQKLFDKNEQLHGHLPRMPFKSMRILQSRIDNVYQHMTLCKQRNNSTFS